MNLQTTLPDYQVIVNELIKSCKSESSRAATAFSCRMTEREYSNRSARIAVLKEFRTIRFGGARQTGKTYWALKHLENNLTDTIIAMKDRNLVDSHIDRWIEENQERVSLEFQKEFTSRIINQHNLKEYNPKYPFFNKPVTKKAPKYIIIDEASNHLHFFVNSLYEWIATTADEDPVIILVG